MFSQFSYPAKIEEAIDVIEYLLTQDYELSLTKKDYKISKRSLALLLLQKDPVFWQEAQQQEPRFQEISHPSNPGAI